MSTDYEEMEAPGWAALDAAFSAVFREQIPHQYTSQAPYELDKPHPLPAIHVWEDKASDSWVYVSYGLTELFAKSSEDAEVSGFGFELTFSIPRDEGEEQPPGWPLLLLQGLGHHVLSERQGFDSGHCIDLASSLVPGGTSQLCGVVCVPDPILGKLSTSHGSVLLLRLVGLNAEELQLLGKLPMEDKVQAVSELVPDGVTHPQRAAWSEDAEKSKIIRRLRLGLSL